MTVVCTPSNLDKQRTNGDRRAADLMTALTELPVGHPSRGRAREQAIRAWLPMANRLARRYAGRGEPIDDLYQTASIGLIRAVDRFDPGHGIEFAGYAVPTIIGEIKRHFRDRTWSIRVPRRLQEMRLAINQANNTLPHTLGRAPTVADIAVHLGVTEEEVLEGLEGARAYRATSLSKPNAADTTQEVGDTIGGDDHGYELAELRLVLGPALAALEDRQRRILMMRFYGNRTQSQIAGEIGVSQMHISRLITKALAELRTHLDVNAN